MKQMWKCDSRIHHSSITSGVQNLIIFLNPWTILNIYMCHLFIFCSLSGSRLQVQQAKPCSPSPTYLDILPNVPWRLFPWPTWKISRKQPGEIPKQMTGWCQCDLFSKLENCSPLPISYAVRRVKIKSMWLNSQFMNHFIWHPGWLNS